MTIQPQNLLNWPFREVVQTYGAEQTMLYALSIGLGGDPADRDQLTYVVEDNLRAFPTMATVLACSPPWSADANSGINRTMLVHGEQGLTIHKPLPATGTVKALERIVDIVDKGEGRGALVFSERTIRDAESGDLLATLRATIFCRGDGGFGGKNGPVPQPKTVPERPCDLVVDMPTVPQQALLYRLNNDRNPLHADPDIAAAAGFSRPILHGLCTWAIAAHAVVRSCCGYDAAKLREFQTRFSGPVLPGETISIEIWRTGREVSFRGFVRAREAKVLDAGYALLGDE